MPFMTGTSMSEIPESGQIQLSKSLIGSLLNNEQTAIEFATVILRRLHGEAELAKQQPLRVADQGQDWVVEGSYQEPGKLPGTGSWFIRARKSDCRVEKFGHYEPWEIPEEVKEIVGKAKDSNPGR
jgi:hypothetical protein